MLFRKYKPPRQIILKVKQVKNISRRQEYPETSECLWMYMVHKLPRLSS